MDISSLVRRRERRSIFFGTGAPIQMSWTTYGWDGGFLAIDENGVADSCIPAEHRMKDVIEIGHLQGVWHRDESDDHWVDVAENRPENHSFEGCCWHPLRLSDPRPCAALPIRMFLSKTCSTWPGIPAPPQRRIYDRRRRKITRNIVERISI